MNNLHDLLAALNGAPELPGAACVGMPTAFDPAEHGEPATDVEYRHQAALHLCRTCSALASCTEWFDSLKPSKRPVGVIAGQINHPRLPGRPRKETAR
ncbi:hypothetical protein [Mycolicibacterium fortuitum]|jgi:hypothetical protein|uniref:hypothetical protein n=1 Tax=Mycolicibacterium fortuitum TaxID=1766 RepID=UPI0007EA8ADF|nr:hypothetical protein [Mycolicibacterium fortuitum]OBG48325.1 hypothetical protein A5670_02985 [Mycolicibacterium fortuitum]